MTNRCMVTYYKNTDEGVVGEAFKVMDIAEARQIARSLLEDEKALEGMENGTPEKRETLRRYRINSELYNEKARAIRGSYGITKDAFYRMMRGDD